MRMQVYDRTVKVWLSANDTYDWAHKSGASWPCSQLSGRRVFAEFCGGDLVDVSFDGGRGEQDCDGTEFNACFADHIARRLPKDHPDFDILVTRFQ